MTPERKTALNRLRDSIVIPGLAGAAARRIAAAAPPADVRPRYSAGPLAGKLKSKRARLEESLGLDGPADEVGEWLPEALQIPAWREAYATYERLYGDEVGAEKIAARSEAGIEIAAKHLGLTVEQFKIMQADPARMGELLAREHNARTREQIASLEADLRPLPEKVEPEAPAE